MPLEYCLTGVSRIRRRRRSRRWRRTGGGSPGSSCRARRPRGRCCLGRRVRDGSRHRLQAGSRRGHAARRGRRWAKDAGEDLEERGLAGAVVADDADGLAGSMSKLRSSRARKESLAERLRLRGKRLERFRTEIAASCLLRKRRFKCRKRITEAIARARAETEDPKRIERSRAV